MFERWRDAMLRLPNWDGRMVIAALFILGYYALIFRMTSKGVPEANVEMIKDSLIVLGPAIGVIVGALFRNTLADERREHVRSEDLRTAMTTSPAPAETAAPATVERAAHAGAREGAEEGVESALGEPARPAPATPRAPVVDLSQE